MSALFFKTELINIPNDDPAYTRIITVNVKKMKFSNPSSSPTAKYTMLQNSKGMKNETGSSIKDFERKYVVTPYNLSPYSFIITSHSSSKIRIESKSPNMSWVITMKNNTPIQSLTPIGKSHLSDQNNTLVTNDIKRVDKIFILRKWGFQ